MIQALFMCAAVFPEQAAPLTEEIWQSLQISYGLLEHERYEIERDGVQSGPALAAELDQAGRQWDAVELLADAICLRPPPSGVCSAGDDVPF